MRQKISLLIASIGLWLAMAPMTFGYTSSAMQASDIISGCLLILVGLLANTRLIRLSALIGVWLQLAPLFFWAPEASSYLNDTLVGMILMILIFSLPGFSDEEKGGEVPRGWSFNPSAWGPRSVTVFLALVAWFLARYLAAYQLGYISTIHDPFFGDGTIKVISSSLAQGFPISDAGLGAFGYSLEFFFGLIGSSRRWKTMPWVSILFGLMVIPAGMISILLIVLQPVLVGAWCGICLMIAVCMLTMILLTIPEMKATCQLLAKARKNQSFWTVFWQGDRSASQGSPPKPIDRNKTSEFGFTLPWNLALSAFLGVLLMASPSFFGDLHPAADSNYIVGPLLIAVSVISFSEVARSLRFVNFFLGAALVVSSFFLEGFTTAGWTCNLILGASICLLSLSGGKRRERYGERQ